MQPRPLLHVLALAGLLAAGCTATQNLERSVRASGAVGSPAAGSAPGGGAPLGRALPAPDGPIDGSPPALARDLESTWAARRDAVAGWLRSGGGSAWPPPREVVLLVLHEQRIYRFLVPREHLAARVLGRLRGPLAREARANLIAGGALYEHSSPVRRLPDLRTRPPEPPEVLWSYFREAEARFGVDREVLAAVMLIESRMGRVVSPSSAGARGPMQFLPATWRAYGLGGDVHDARDAVLGAANYLRASGAPKDDRAALYRYNPVEAYVRAVMRYASVMRRDPSAYYAYYNWQVFVRTTKGDVRLTGPGR